MGPFTNSLENSERVSELSIRNSEFFVINRERKVSDLLLYTSSSGSHTDCNSSNKYYFKANIPEFEHSNCYNTGIIKKEKF